ncbi:MAG: GIY-YIG nuclease family protein [Anaerolineae bacterium]|nr:GIY-YIG nuclease family protein [Anaerolineae bacterium]
MGVKIYLAGGFFWNEDDWRYDLVNGLNGKAPTVPLRGDLKKWGVLPNAIFGCLDFIGPYPMKLDGDNAFLLREAIEDSDIVFAWADRLLPSELSKLSLEIGYAKARDKLVGVGYKTEIDSSWKDIWVASRLASFLPFDYKGETPELALRECLRSLLDFVPPEQRIALWKSNSARGLFEQKSGRFGYVYVIRAETGHYKIGRTSNVPDRMKLFGVKLPFQFEIVNYFPCEDMVRVESWLHELYADSRVNGEWFSLSDDNAASLRSIYYADDLGCWNKSGELELYLRNKG